jgi:hypothetical protein
MPYKTKSIGKGRVKVTSPHGTKAKSTTPAKAKRQMNLLRAVEHSNRKPTGKPARDAIKKRVMGGY